MGLLDWFTLPPAEAKKENAQQPQTPQTPKRDAAADLYKEIMGKGRKKWCLEQLQLTEDDLNMLKKVKSGHQTEKSKPEIELNLKKAFNLLYKENSSLAKELDDLPEDRLRLSAKTTVSGKLEKKASIAKAVFALLLLQHKRSQ